MAKIKGQKKPAMIRVAGKQYPCRITMGALVRFKRLTGHDLESLDYSKLEELLLFVWCCVASACVADKITFDITSEEFPDHVEPDGLTDFFEAMPEVEKKTPANLTSNG